LCHSRKYLCPPQERLTEIPRERGVSKAKILKGKYGAKLELSEGCGDSNKKSFLDGIWIFSGATHFYVTNGNFNCYLFLTHFNPLCIM